MKRLIDSPPRPSVRPTPLRDEPDWSAAWIPGLPALMMLFQLIALPLLLAGVPFAPTTLLLSTIVADLLAVGVAWVALCRRRGRSLGSLGLRRPRKSIQWLTLPAAGAVGTVVMLLSADLVYTLLTGRAEPPPQRSVELLQGLRGSGARILAFAAVCLVAPVTEEIVFRGVVFQALRRRTSAVSAVLISAAIFSAAHLDLQHALHLFGMGVVLAFLMNRSGSLYPGMILHAGINAAALLFAW